MKKSKYLICFNVLLIVLLLSGNKLFAQKLTANERLIFSQLKNYKRGKLLFRETFSGTLSNWQSEGKVNAEIIAGKLRFESQSAVTENPKGNIWWKIDVQSPYILEFDYKSLTNFGLSMIFWNAQTLDGKSLFDEKRTGKYEEYINGNLKAYHISFHRFGSGESNIRKAPGFHLISSTTDPIKMNDTTWHRISIVSLQKRQLVFFDGVLIHQVQDNGQPCLSETSWQHQLPCKGTGEPCLGGAVGIRHTQKQIADYDNFTIYRLLPNEVKKR